MKICFDESRILKFTKSTCAFWPVLSMTRPTKSNFETAKHFFCGSGKLAWILSFMLCGKSIFTANIVAALCTPNKAL